MNIIKSIVKKNKIIYKIAIWLNNLPIIGALNPLYVREFYIFPEKKLVYLKMHKVACTSIQKSLLRIHSSDEKIEFTKETDIHKEIQWNVCNTLNSNQKKYYKFTFVRNPFDRLVSCYKNQFIEFKKNREVFLYKYYLGGVFKETDSFEDFVKKVCKISDHRADCHFKSQYSLAYNIWGKCMLNYIGKFENMNQEFLPIQQKYDLAPLPHFNQTTPTNYMNYYSTKLAKMVYRQYKRDIHYFGYGKEYQKLLAHCKINQ